MYISIVTILFIIVSMFFLFRRWINKNFSNDYLFIIIALIISFFNYSFYGNLAACVNIPAYFAVTACVIPHLRDLKNRKSTNYNIKLFNELKLFYNVSTLSFILLTLIITSIVILDRINLDLLYSIVSFVYSLVILIKQYMLWNIEKILDYKLIIKSWILYMTLIILCNVIRYITFDYGTWDIITNIIVLLFILTRGVK